MLYLLVPTPSQHVALGGSDYWLGNKKHMLQITVQFPESLWTLTANTSVSGNVCISFFRSLRTLITRSLVYFRAKQTLNYQWGLNHLYHIEFWNFQVKLWNFMKDINSLLKDEHYFAWCEMCYMGGCGKTQKFFSVPWGALWGSNGSDITVCVMAFHSGFVFQISKEELTQYFPRTWTLFYAPSTALNMGKMLISV